MSIPFRKENAIVLMGDGINCENETAHALSLADFEVDTLHVSNLLARPDRLGTASLLVFPEGFSFGDEIESGKVLALKLMERVRSELLDFVDSGRLVLGICNGFQALVQMGLLPETTPDGKNSVSLLKNRSGCFINRWIDLTVSGDNSSGYLEGMQNLSLPIRHGEGRLAVNEKNKSAMEQTEQNAILKYTEDVNGSHDKIAALSNKAGNVLGMMPHPEAFIRWSHHPGWTTMKLENPGLVALDFEKDRNVDDPEKVPHGLRILQNARKMTESL